MGQLFKSFFISAVILGLAIAGAVTLYLNRPEPAKVEIEATPLVVDVAEVVKQDVPVSVSSQGTISPRTQTILIAEVGGRVVKVSPKFKAGGFFEAGDMLLQIDDRDYRAELKRAEAAVASARSNLALEKGRAEVAYRDWLKFSNGVKRNGEADALAQRKPQLAEAQARLDSAEADLIRARDDLDRTTIRLPYAGMVQQKQVDIGQYVTLGTQLGKTFAVDVAEVRLPIPDDRLNYVNLPAINGDLTTAPSVTLSTTQGDQIHEWQAQLVRTEGVLDERSRVLFAVAEINDPYGLKTPREAPLRIGTFVQANIAGKTISDIVVLPRHILRTGNQVWVVDDSNRLINRQVKLLRTDGALAYIYQGLESGERVSLSSAPFAVAGTQVLLNSSIKTSTLLSEKSVTREKRSATNKGV
ncbi:efflux RND transporter periplasmic adaptor subunit [Litorivivens sp.]|uniref:efflux RND transporter periplasmic adaptor subunit n=1 Tax=Litorivivens sp. TaxID=2020868 RepID=UPI00356606EA